MDYFLLALRRYADFKGRSRRKELWMFVLFNIIFAVAAMFIDRLLFGAEFFGAIYSLYSLLMLVPGISVAVRRMHDLNKSGWFLLVAFIPLVGSIWLLVLYCTDGNRGDNQYGPDPKAEPILAA